MTDIFWTISTSTTALTIDGIVLLAALIVGYFPLAKYLPVVGPYVEAAKLVAAIVLFVIGICLGHRIADESTALKQTKADLAFSQLQLDAQKQSAATADKLRVEAEQQAEQANQKVTEYEAKLASQPAGCSCDLDTGDVNSLRGIAK